MNQNIVTQAEEDNQFCLGKNKGDFYTEYDSEK